MNEITRSTNSETDENINENGKKCKQKTETSENQKVIK